jgi:prepilin-type N-terminal cleavage/methylation domain-containing protein
MRTNYGQLGFTLVEIAIVLVIIGLLLGGILKGQEMITQARIKNVINDFNGITAAYASYQDRYRAIPGDDPRAGTRWAGPAPAPVAVSGDGNGTLLGLYNANPAGATPVAAEESNLFWWHMRIAGFIPGATTGAGVGSQPTNAFGGKIGAQDAGGGAALGLSGLVVCSAGVPDKVAIAVDTQMDDQASASGSIRAMIGDSTTALVAAPAGNYAETGTNTYILCKGV